MTVPLRTGNTDEGYLGPSTTQTFSNVTGTVVLPTATGPVEVDIHAPYGYRTCNWSVSRANRPPLAPAMEDVGDDTFLGGTISTLTPQVNPQTGDYSWSLSGTYTYLQKKIRKPGETTIPAGGYPYVVPIADAAARSYVAGVNLSSGDAGEVLGAAFVDHKRPFPWPFTLYPPQMGTPPSVYFGEA